MTFDTTSVHCVRHTWQTFPVFIKTGGHLPSIHCHLSWWGDGRGLPCSSYCDLLSLLTIEIPTSQVLFIPLSDGCFDDGRIKKLVLTRRSWAVMNMGNKRPLNPSAESSNCFGSIRDVGQHAFISLAAGIVEKRCEVFYSSVKPSIPSSGLIMCLILC